MNQEADNKELFLTWQGQVTGPHSVSDVRYLLKLGKIHSLYKIQIEGQWVLLRDNFAALEKKAREEAFIRSSRVAKLPPSSPPLVKPISEPDGNRLVSNSLGFGSNLSQRNTDSSRIAKPLTAIATFSALQNMRIMQEMEESNQHLEEIEQNLSNIEEDFTVDTGNFLDF